MGTLWLVTAGLLILSCGCVSSFALTFSSGSDSPTVQPDDPSFVEALLDQRVVRLRRIERLLELPGGETFSQCAVEIVTEDGRHFLIQKGGNTVVVNVNHISEKWTPVSNWKVPNDKIRVRDMVKAEGKDYQFIIENCQDASNTPPADPIVDLQPQVPQEDRIPTEGHEGSGVGHVGSKIEDFVSKIDNFGSKLQHVGSKMGHYGSKMQYYGSKMGKFGPKMGKLGSKIGSLGSKIGKVGAKIGGVGKKIGSLQSTLAAKLKLGPFAKFCVAAYLASKTGRVPDLCGSTLALLSSRLARIGKTLGRVGKNIGRVGKVVVRRFGKKVKFVGKKIGRVGKKVGHVLKKVGRVGKKAGHVLKKVGSVGRAIRKNFGRRRWRREAGIEGSEVDMQAEMDAPEEDSELEVPEEDMKSELEFPEEDMKSELEIPEEDGQTEDKFQ